MMAWLMQGLKERMVRRLLSLMTINVDHARNKAGLRDHPLPKIRKEFKETKISQDFLGVPS